MTNFTTEYRPPLGQQLSKTADTARPMLTPISFRPWPLFADDSAAGDSAAFVARPPPVKIVVPCARPAPEPFVDKGALVRAGDVVGSIFISGFGHVLNAVGWLLRHPRWCGAKYPAPGEVAARQKAIVGAVAAMKISAAAAVVVADLRQAGATLIDIWQGSHLIAAGDGGALYEKWRGLTVTPRTSSHYTSSPTQQYEMLIDGRAAFLFGKTPAGDTWCQAEDVGKEVSLRSEFWSFVRYSLAEENIGPLGFSPHVDHLPVILHGASSR